MVLTMPKKDNPKSSYVTWEFCDERFGRIMDKLNGIDAKMDELKKSVGKREWTAKEKAIVVSSLIIAVASIIVALIS